MITYTNENIEANNNTKIIDEKNFELYDFGYDKPIFIQNEMKKEKKSQNNFFSNFISNLFTKKNEIIKKKDLYINHL